MERVLFNVLRTTITYKHIHYYSYMLCTWAYCQSTICGYFQVFPYLQRENGENGRAAASAPPPVPLRRLHYRASRP